VKGHEDAECQLLVDLKAISDSRQHDTSLEQSVEDYLSVCSILSVHLSRTSSSKESHM
jgi:predicted GTPase